MCMMNLKVIFAPLHQGILRAWLESMVVIPCTRCWVTSVWWDFWGFTHFLEIITRPLKFSRTLSSTRRYNFISWVWWVHFNLHLSSVHSICCLSEYVLSCAWVPDYHLLLCWFCLLDDEAVPGCHSRLCQHSALHPEDQKYVPEVNI